MDEEGKATGERAEAEDESDELLAGLQALLPWPLFFLRFGMAIEDDMVLAAIEPGSLRGRSGRRWLGTVSR